MASWLMGAPRAPGPAPPLAAGLSCFISLILELILALVGAAVAPEFWFYGPPYAPTALFLFRLVLDVFLCAYCDTYFRVFDELFACYYRWFESSRCRAAIRSLDRWYMLEPWARVWDPLLLFCEVYLGLAALRW